jgi:hypothetical protein
VGGVLLDARLTPYQIRLRTDWLVPGKRSVTVRLIRRPRKTESTTMSRKKRNQTMTV